MMNQTKITNYYSPKVEQTKNVEECFFSKQTKIVEELFTKQDQQDYINKLTEDQRVNLYNYKMKTINKLKNKITKEEYQQRQHYLKHRGLLINYRKSLKQSLICEKNFKEQKPKVVKKKPKVIKKKKMKANTVRKVMKYLKYEKDMKTFKYEKDFVVDSEATITGVYKMTLIYDKAPERPTDEEFEEYKKKTNL